MENIEPYIKNEATGEPVSRDMENSFSDHGDYVVIYDKLGEDTVRGYLEYAEPDLKPAVEALEGEFEIMKEDFAPYAGDRSESGGTHSMRIIKRKADGATFGFAFWSGSDNWADAEPNGESVGIDFETESEFWDNPQAYFPRPYVFKKVVPFTIIGYEFPDSK